jgi:hypothetical protein
MDGHITKPLTITVLNREIARLEIRQPLITT